jgi:hypothetical protein
VEAVVRPAIDPRLARRQLLAGATALAPSSLLAFTVVRAVPPPQVFLHPAMVLALAGIWFGAFCLAYLFEIGALAREARRREGLELTGVRIAWAGAPLTRGRAGARAEFVASDGRYPTNVTLHLNLNATWSFFLVGIETAWAAREDGVLLIGASGSRFLAGATVEGLALPSVEGATLRAVLEPGGPRRQLPDWGRPPGPHAVAALEDVRPGQWLLGPDQPYIAFEAHGARIEKWWSAPFDRLYALDPGTGLDLARIIRAFDADALAQRGSGAPTSSLPSSPAP